MVLSLLGKEKLWSSCAAFIVVCGNNGSQLVKDGSLSFPRAGIANWFIYELWSVELFLCNRHVKTCPFVFTLTLTHRTNMYISLQSVSISTLPSYLPEIKLGISLPWVRLCIYIVRLWLDSYSFELELYGAILLIFFLLAILLEGGNLYFV